MADRSNQLRVLHVVASTDRRGAETAAVELCARLGQLGCVGSLVALEPGGIGGLEIPFLGRTRFSWRGLVDLRSQARSADVVIAHGSSTLPAVSAATVGLSTPFVYRSIGDPSAWATTQARRARTRASIRRAAGVVALWQGAAVFWHEDLRVPAERITVIPNWVDARRFPLTMPQVRASARAEFDLPPQGAVALYLGALTAEKRVDLAVRAAGSVEDLTLLVVGEGPERAALANLALRWPSRIRLLGATAEPLKPLAAADILVLPSETEGQPAVAIEAGLTGLPVVAAPVGGIPGIVLDGRTGILVEDISTEVWAGAMSEALANRDSMGISARDHCLEKFDLDRIGRIWVEFLHQVLSG